MKKIIFFFLLMTTVGFSQTTTVPSPALAEGPVTINFDKSGTPLAATTAIYAHIGVNVNGTRWQNTKGTWGTTNAPLLTLVSGTTYKLDLTPDLYTYFGVPTTSSITEICVVFRNANGSVQTSPDIFISVGNFQATLTSPVLYNTIINSGSSLTVAANNTNGNANYNLFANGTSINTFVGSSYSFTDNNILANKSYDLRITQGATTFSKKFTVIVNPGTVSETIPAGLVEGINYNTVDATKATLVLDAPGKDFIYVAGSFNNWQPGATYAMKKDATAGSTKFWLELTGLVSGTNYTYQYWVVDESPVSGSPVLVKTADPYSTLVLNKEDDPWIPAGNYPNLPAYPAGQDREVTVLQTGQTPYAWSAATTNFVKPEKDKLVVYEVLVRDFDANRSYQNLINKIDYFKNLKINAIELMPVMEFDGNESWGYNTSFHMALDKAYGPSSKLKELVDLCHQNGIAVILDVALNHAFGRSPMDRMWMNDPDGDGWGGPASDNPYFNVSAMHSYNVGNDYNHQLTRTKTYVKRVVKQWIEEYKIDGFRWDLTKGFTQNCPSAVAGGQDNCTNTIQQDRVDVLKEYVDYSWSLDPTHYAIFEHLGNDNEEQLWANYRIAETPSKGVMMWGKMTNEYNQLSMGYNSSNNIERMGYDAHGFTGKRVMGYAESHDEEQLMYKNVTFGLSSNPAHNVKNLNTALSRMSAIGAVSLLVPGPKMIWHFGALGWEKSIWTCNNGTVNSDYDGGVPPGDCKLDTKPQPQWVNNWLGDINRNKIYFDWAKMISLKTTEAVFNTNITANSGFDIQSGNTFTPKLFIWDNSMSATQLKNVVVLTNFDVNSQNVIPNFPYIGTWYNLMDNTSFEVTSTTATIAIEAGGYRIYGNKPSTLGTDTFEVNGEIYLYPNPATNYFTLNATTSKVEIYSITGQLVKSFNANQSKENQYPISDLNSGIYLVKAVDENNEQKVMKLLKL
ncbi:T9SS type A sorting domain-containing protein [Flavobacterium franklandianum]|uniref:T9SS type A sorting domain-containing protein n=1 Tax=Flavobacterium franklandianum TaxID=2594430 RepID=A0A553CKJ4_9FLAO|nr:alpha-amylase family glycosyl hydrolase [Flavobacterium franklandianum]TRX21036.1 T9SS type A sorting domain-containing protein [Flavobacterium franklandianum]TRX29081.1 T9SS type A sorting domain-containing protein [Flavobacterium franklandianum]